MDVFITLLSLGEKGYRSLLAEREALSGAFASDCARLPPPTERLRLKQQDQRMSLDGFAEVGRVIAVKRDGLGPCFSRISGTRVIKRQSATKTIAGRTSE